jgi:hypothetical protein
MDGKFRSRDGEGKLDHERRKIELEIHDLSRPWFTRPQYLSAILPAIIGGLTVFVLFNRGYFDAREERQRAEEIRLDNKRTVLSNDIQRMEASLASLNEELAESKITVDLERLVRVMEPNNVIGIQRHVNRVLGSAPTDAELVAPTLLALGKLVAVNDNFVPERLAIVRRYIEGPTTPPEMKEALKAILERKQEAASVLRLTAPRPIR